MPARLLVIGIDAASPALVRRLATAGKLPALRALMDRGVSGPVRGVEGFFIGSTWPSFYTGRNPAGHGFYRIEQLKSGSYDYFRPLDGGIGAPPFWETASEAGRRVAVLDVPLSRINGELNGIQTVEWGGHDAVFGFRTSPPGLAGDILSTVGPYPLPSSCDAPRSTADDFERFASGLEHAVAAKTRLTLDLLDRDAWDLFVQVFTEAHCAGHQMWHIHDPGHPAHDPDLLADIGDPVERVYRSIDRAVAAIVERAGDAAILLVSAHGMRSFHGASFLLPGILRRLGVTVRPPRNPSTPPTLAGRLAGRIGKLLPAAGRRVFPSRERAAGPPAGGPRRGIRFDVSRSRCFPVPNGMPVGAIRLNLAGREPCGVLEPGAEAEDFCAELIRDLLEIVDERTGRPLVAAVRRSGDLYRGERLDDLPDLLVEWAADLPTGSPGHASGRGATIAVTSDRIGRVEAANKSGRTGEHVPEGMFVFAGRDAAPATLERPVAVTDFHPTICRLLSLPDPGVDGAVIAELASRRGPEP